MWDRLSTVALVDVFGLFTISETVFVGIGSLVILVLLALSGFFSSSEIAMFSLADHRLEQLVQDGTPGAETVASLKDDPHRLLVTILVGNNLVNIAMSSIATGLLALYFAQGTAVAIATRSRTPWRTRSRGRCGSPRG
jgi:Mg2+/Co2+ transporter CorB